ncbi:class I SAM-dependent methyltransferase [Mycolicibacterium sp.]|uniref:class I SAM-dependent methyltransferase n=1 Tax=Mycolicibacterium sp. TaxID=2320850 RepID=UPI001D6E0BEC|nr:class I SAM-dependent methyltransferase [Mycolicibacterium sp.]MCB1291732.1 class I SAM-dependent methyltransferase [Mycobacterium sp.]MCB9410832.1 class I SAM-dependent methyltransferase [Mycolicibacterium sp.]
MAIDYNQGHIAEQYQEAKKQAWRDRVETYSFMNRIGDITGKKVLDVACGEGHFTRLLRRAGAARVVGLDISERMIALAREQEAREPLGIDYIVADARSIVDQEDYDIVVSAWLLVYAQDRAALASMCQGLACRVKPGGRFVTVTTNPGVYSFRPDYRKYGFEVELADAVFEGAPIDITVNLADSSLEVRNYYLPIEAYASAFRAAGFHDFAVHIPDLEPAAETVDEGDYWDYLLDNPFLVVMDCVRD